MRTKTSILLVEDNPDDALLFQRAYKKRNTKYPLHVVEHGAKAVSYLAGEGDYGQSRKVSIA